MLVKNKYSLVIYICFYLYLEYTVLQSKNITEALIFKITCFKHAYGPPLYKNNVCSYILTQLNLK